MTLATMPVRRRSVALALCLVMGVVAWSPADITAREAGQRRPESERRRTSRRPTLWSWIRAERAAPTAAQLQAAHPTPAKALGRIALQGGPHASRAAALIGVLPGVSARRALVGLVRGRDATVAGVAVAAWGLGPLRRGEPRAHRVAVSWLGDARPAVRSAAAQALVWSHRPRRARDRLAARRAVERDVGVRRAIDRALVQVDRRLGRRRGKHRRRR